MKDELLEQIGENYQYVHTIVSNKVELAKIEIARNSTEILSKVILGLTMFIFSMITLLFLSIALAIWIGNLSGSSIIGYVSVAIIYIVVAVICYMNKTRFIERPISNLIADTLYPDKELEIEESKPYVTPS